MFISQWFDNCMELMRPVLAIVANIFVRQKSVYVTYESQREVIASLNFHMYHL